MKMNFYYPLLVILLTITVITGCNQATKTASGNNISWDSIHVDKTYHMLEDTNNPSCNLKVDFVFPAGLEDQEVLKAVQRQFINSCMGESYKSLAPAEAVDRYVEDYLAEYKKLEKDFLAEKEHDHDEPGGSWFSYYESFSDNITYNGNNLLCYGIDYEKYTGGAHGSHSSQSYLIDMQTGLVVTESELFTEGFQEELANIIVGKIVEKNKAKDAKELEDMGFFSVDEIYPNNNFSVDDAGITYHFNEYEIAAYVVGPTKVFIPYGEIKHLLRADSKIAPLAAH
ncbi:MAG: DUF3298 and DUF4163 domain-containing protein [Tannerellaceae bacterium]|jgi:hypothetical protein|nr:DUF3298 and DUF4163 domain-containing protein [Tannerellaceae bacterium]